MSQRTDYDYALRKRIALILQISGLEIPGLAEFAAVSRSHLYSVLNGNKSLTEETAYRIGKGFKLAAAQIFDLDYEIPASIRATPALLEFMVKERDIPEYFQHTKDARKSSFYIEQELIHAKIFKVDKPVYLWQVRKFCFAEERYYSPDELSKLLREQVKKKNLISKKRPILRRNGTFGSRSVNVYFKPSSTHS